MAVSTSSSLDSAALRADFPFLEEQVDGKPLAYLDSASSTQKPRQVLDRMRSFYEHEYANVHRGVYRLAERATEGYEGARRTVAAFVNAPSEREVIFTRSATEAINLVAYAWGLQNLGPGDTVVITELEHHANFVPWQFIASKTGASFRHIPIDDAGELQLDALDGLAREGSIKVVATGLVSNSLGTINPVERLAAWAHEQGAIMVVDAAQAAPHRTIDVQALGCDFLAFSSHKLCGPSGVGALWGRRELLEAMEPFNLGGEMIRSVSLERTTFNELPHKFEAGTPAIAEAVGFGAAIDYISEIGLPAIEQHEHELTVYALGRLGELEWVRLFGPPAERRAGIVSFEVAGVHPHDVAQILDWDGVCVRAGHHCTQPLMTRLGVTATTRASFYVYSVAEEVDRLVDGPPQGQEEPRMSEFEQMYREVILDHYKTPRNHGLLEPNDAVAEGQNPLCGDEVTVSVRFGPDDVIESVGFEGRGCAISQAATSMLTEIVVGRTAQDVASMPKEELLDEIGIPLTPVRLKCALLGLGVLKVALNKSKGTPLPEEWGTSSGEIFVG